jgi:hypothetical protein
VGKLTPRSSPFLSPLSKKAPLAAIILHGGERRGLADTTEVSGRVADRLRNGSVFPLGSAFNRQKGKGKRLTDGGSVLYVPCPSLAQLNTNRQTQPPS